MHRFFLDVRFTGPPTHSVGGRLLRLVTVAGVCRRHRPSSSVVVCNTRICNVTHQGAARDGGRIVLCPVRSTPWQNLGDNLHWRPSLQIMGDSSVLSHIVIYAHELNQHLKCLGKSLFHSKAESYCPGRQTDTHTLEKVHALPEPHDDRWKANLYFT